MTKFAQRLLAFEVAAGRSAGASGSTAFRVCEKLRLSLGKFLGTAGFHALLARALALACAEEPWLRALRIEADGSMQGFDDVAPKISNDQLSAGETALVAQLLALLVIFIGPIITVGLMQETWPQAGFDNLDLGAEELP